MFKMESVNDLWEHLAYVLGYAPNDFPVEDFLQDKDQMNLEKAFKQLRDGVEIAYPENEYAGHRVKLNVILDESYKAYKAGEETKAGRLLISFQNEIFRPKGARIERCNLLQQ